MAGGETKMKNKKTIKRKTIFLLIAVAVIAAVLSTALAHYYSNKGIVETQKVQMDLAVKESVAFNLDTDKLHFGGVPPEGSSGRSISIVNKRDFPLKVRFYLSGELADWVNPEDNPVYLQPFENKSIKFIATVPKNAEFGNYTGEIDVIFKKA